MSSSSYYYCAGARVMLAASSRVRVRLSKHGHRYCLSSSSSFWAANHHRCLASVATSTTSAEGGGGGECLRGTARMSQIATAMMMTMMGGSAVILSSSSRSTSSINNGNITNTRANFATTTAQCEEEQQQQQHQDEPTATTSPMATSTTSNNPTNTNDVNLTRRLTIKRHPSNHTSLSAASNNKSPKIGDPFPLCQPPPHNREVCGPVGIPSRAEQLRKLKRHGAASSSIDTNATLGNSSMSNSPYYDILVIGGGATGAGIAFDAVTRTSTNNSSSSDHTPLLKVACIERGDFSSETSSRSTKLIWAGIKYLASASSSLLSWNLFTSPISTMREFYEEFQMVRSCAHERQYMLEKQKHLTNWIPIVCPFTQWHIWPPPFGHWLFSFFPILAPVVFKFYDGLSGFTCPSSFLMGQKSCRRHFPQLNEQDIKYCAVFYEGQHNDARTNLAIALSAAEYGADIANYVEMTEAIFNEDGKVIGVKALDRITGETFPIYAKHVIFAGGPFTDALRQLEDGTDKPVESAVMAASGSHVVLPGYYAPPDMGLLDYNTSDGRFLFLLPWQGSVIVGTTDKKCPAETLPYPPEEEILWMLKECEKYLSNDLKVRRSDVLSAWRGWRPLAADPNNASTATADGSAPQQVSRDHVISTNPKTGVTFIAGGKWTTWREMAEDTLDHILGVDQPKLKCNTLDIVLHGGEGYSESLSIQLIQKYGLMEDVAEVSVFVE